MPDQPPTSARARHSLRLGLCSLFLSVFTGIPAVVQGIRGLREIRRSAGGLKGRGLALAGVALGLLGSAGGVAGLVLAVEKAREAADRMH